MRIVKLLLALLYRVYSYFFDTVEVEVEEIVSDTPICDIFGLTVEEDLDDSHIYSKVSMGKSALRDFGGDLVDQWDSDKWDMGKDNRWNKRNWKSYRKTQYYTKTMK